MSTTRTFWNEQADSYARTWQSPGRHEMARRELDFLTSNARTSAQRSVLDIGIGSGRVLAHHLQTSPAPEVFGVDLAIDMVARCRKLFTDEPRISGLVVADVASGLPFARSFDVISAIRVLKYSEQWRRSVHVIAGLLAPDGVTVFSMPNRSSINRFSRDYGVPWHATTANELVEVCRTSGLDVIDIAGFTRLPYSLYDKVTSRVASRVTIGAEDLATKLLGRRAFARELFVAAKRR